MLFRSAPIAPAVTGGFAWWIHADPSAIAAIALTSLASHVIGGLYLSPDLDLNGMMRCKSWWRWERLGLGWDWRGYPKLAGCHRSAKSHAPILGTATRLGYLAVISAVCIPAIARHWRRSIAVAALTTVAANHAPWWALLCAAIVGVEFSAIAHYAQDGIVFGPWHKQQRRSPKRKISAPRRRSA